MDTPNGRRVDQLLAELDRLVRALESGRFSKEKQEESTYRAQKLAQEIKKLLTDDDKVVQERVAALEDAIPVDWQLQMSDEWREVQLNMGPGGGGSYNRQHLAMGRFSMNTNPHKSSSKLLPS